MLSQKAIEEASAMLHASLANHKQPSDGKPVKRRTYAEREEEERQLHEDPYGCGGAFGRWLEAERKAKDLAARKAVEPLVDKRRKNGPRVPLALILDRLRGGAWASPQDLAKAYGRACGWVVKLRSVAIAQKLITKEEWSAAFRRGCESHSDDGKRVLSSEVRATRPQRSTNQPAP